MPSSFKYLPRAVYYLNLRKSLANFLKVTWSDTWSENGEKVREFKQSLCKFTDYPELHFTGHARIALFHILRFLAFPRGSEILMTPISLAEMLKMVRLNDLVPKFVGYKVGSFDLDYSSAAVTDKTKAFLYTPLAGIHTPPDELLAFCKKHNLILIQDLTQSFTGREFRTEIAVGDYNFWSLCDLKTLHTHRGGIVHGRNEQFNNYMQEASASWFLPPSRKYFLTFIFEDLISGLFLNREFFNCIGHFVVSVMRKIDPHLLENITAGNAFSKSQSELLKNFMASGNDWQSSEIPPEQKYRYCDVLAETGLERLPLTNDIIRRRNTNVRSFYSQLSPGARKLMPTNLREERQLFWRAPLLVSDFLGFQEFLWNYNIDCARSNLPWLPDLLSDSSVPGRQMKENCVYLPIYHYLTPDEVTYVADKVNLYAARNA